MIAYLIALYIVSFLFGYVLVFSGATFLIGKSINFTDSKTGFQDAITPRWYTNLALFTYLIAVPASVIYGFIKYGWLAGIGVIVGLIFFTVLNIIILLPKKDSEHFRALIIQSMMRRYADYLRDHDEFRASAIKDLLERLDVPLPEFARKEKKAL